MRVAIEMEMAMGAKVGRVDATRVWMVLPLVGKDTVARGLWAVPTRPLFLDLIFRRVSGSRNPCFLFFLLRSFIRFVSFGFHFSYVPSCAGFCLNPPLAFDPYPFFISLVFTLSPRDNRGSGHTPVELLVLTGC